MGKNQDGIHGFGPRDRETFLNLGVLTGRNTPITVCYKCFFLFFKAGDEVGLHVRFEESPLTWSLGFGLIERRAAAQRPCQEFESLATYGWREVYLLPTLASDFVCSGMIYFTR